VRSAKLAAMSTAHSRLGAVLGVGFLVVIATISTSCRGATQIVVDIRTNVPCANPMQWQGIAVYSGSPGLDVESKDPSLLSAACEPDGRVGSIVLVPNGANDATVGIRVVAGLTRAPDQCAAARYEGCIVARRTVTFLPHEALDLRIDLTNDCVGQACDALRTCFNGACSDARLTSSVTGDAAAAGATATVRCGDDPTNRCPSDDPEHACCLTVANAKVVAASCKKTTDCAPPSFALLCDKASDCAGKRDDAGAPFICCVANAASSTIRNSQCLSAHECDLGEGFRTFLCNDQIPCGADSAFQCAPRANDLPGYFACDVPTN
jgi:hypothetical protein